MTHMLLFFLWGPGGGTLIDIIYPVFLRCTIVGWVWKLQVGIRLQHLHLTRLFASWTEAIFI